MANAKQTKKTANQHPNEEPTIDLSELFFRLLEKWWILLLCALVCTSIMGVYSFGYSVPIYMATSKVYILSASDSVINLSDLQLGSTLAADYMEIFKIWEVNQEVVDNLQLPYSRDQLASMVSVQKPADTRILYINVYSSNAAESALIANEYANVFREYVAKTMNTDKPQIMSRALTPTNAISSSNSTNLVSGFLVGLMIGVIIVVVQFLTDDKLKTADSIMKATGLTTMAMIPRDAAKNGGGAKNGRRERA